MNPIRLTGALALAAALLVAAPAGAAQISVSGSTFSVVASGWTDDDIVVWQATDRIYVSNLGGGLSTAPGLACSPTVSGLSCPAAGVARITIDSGGGNDSAENATSLPSRLYGGSGRDTLIGGRGIDVLDGGTGADDMWGGPGQDRVDYGSRTSPVRVGIGGGRYDGEEGEEDAVEYDVESVTGGSGADTLYGNGDVNRLDGGPGADEIHGGDASDFITGGPGDDVMYGEGGFDTFYADAVADGADVFHGGSSTWDEVSYAARTASVWVDIDGLADDGAIGEGDDVEPDVERLTGGAGNDSLVGSPDANLISGGNGNDVMSGRDGDDSLYGGNGDDIVWGSNGADAITGGSGVDQLFGGAGMDALNALDAIGGDRLTGGLDSDGCQADVTDVKAECER
jgi:Ca2+-binding RTX toxin-like protein